MCGIVGKVNRDPARPVDAQLLARMQRCIVHRGPDQAGSWLEAPVGLGFQRLAIIDVATGRQPMANEDGSVHVVFNGEIYNFPALREELLAAGHVFQTHSDTETLVHGWEQWGTELPRRLRGMFAFAVWDARQRTLFLARDRVGKKPLYYAHLRPGAPDEALAFASELKSLLADPSFERDVDPQALNHYLSYQYVPQPWSIFRRARKLAPAHWLLYREGQIRTERYWSLPYEPKQQMGEKEAVEATLEALDEAVRVRLMSEVPLGCFLSGGIDSSAVVAMMRRHVTGDLRTFSIGFREEAFNELPYARQVAEKFSTVHEEFIVEPDAVECLGALAWHFDEPFADSSAVPTWYLSKMTRQFVTVALNGDGGDESFAGYHRYRGFPLINRWKRLPRPMRALADAPLHLASRAAPGSVRLELLAWMNRATLGSPERLYAQSMIMFRGYQKEQILVPGWREVLGATGGDSEWLTEEVMRDGSAEAAVDRMMHADIELYLPGALLPKVDRMTMAHSVEGRSPFLDHRLMEFAARLPAELKFKDARLKHLLKQAMLKYFSPEFLDRPKMGFGVPIGDWLRGDLRDLTREMLLGPRARERGFFNMDYVGRLVDHHMRGVQNNQYRLWTLLMFEAWARTFLDRADPLGEGPVRFEK